MTDYRMIQLTAGNPEEAMSWLADHGIPLRKVEVLDMLTLRFQIPGKYCQWVLAQAEDRGWQLRVVKSAGFLQFLKKAGKRPVLLAGVLLYLLAALWIPTRIFFVAVEGNRTIPAQKIREAANNCGLGFGVSRRGVRSEQIKNRLLSAIPELGWAGVNTRGCCAVITVRERNPEQPAESPLSEKMVAVRDGVVDSILVRQGSGLVSSGEAVRQGQTLISGYVDCGRILSATGADGEVFGWTLRNLRVIATTDRIKRGACTGKIWSISLRLGKKWINLLESSGFSDSSCGRIRKEYILTLPGEFRLPVSLVVQVGSFYQTVPGMGDEVDLADAARRILSSEMVAGEILHSTQTQTAGNGWIALDGQYSCREMLGRPQIQEIEDAHG